MERHVTFISAESEVLLLHTCPCELGGITFKVLLNGTQKELKKEASQCAVPSWTNSYGYAWQSPHMPMGMQGCQGCLTTKQDQMKQPEFYHSYYSHVIITSGILKIGNGIIVSKATSRHSSSV